jgi:hypothetical protein
MVSISGDLPILRFLEKHHALSNKMDSISDDLPILRFLEKLHAFSKKWSQYRVTCPF